MHHSQTGDPSSRSDVRYALKQIIEGLSVKRSRHLLEHEGMDLTAAFIEELTRSGFRARTVREVRVQPGQRAPAFYIVDRIAYFGWVFWEQFTSWKLRKLWGSVIKNRKGDWELQLPEGKVATIYANESLVIEMDIDHPPEF